MGPLLLNGVFYPAFERQAVVFFNNVIYLFMALGTRQKAHDEEQYEDQKTSRGNDVNQR